MKRYDLLDTSRNPYVMAMDLVPQPDGEWVRWEDVDALLDILEERLDIGGACYYIDDQACNDHGVCDGCWEMMKVNRGRLSW